MLLLFRTTLLSENSAPASNLTVDELILSEVEDRRAADRARVMEKYSLVLSQMEELDLILFTGSEDVFSILADIVERLSSIPVDDQHTFERFGVSTQASLDLNRLRLANEHLKKGKLDAAATLIDDVISSNSLGFVGIDEISNEHKRAVVLNFWKIHSVSNGAPESYFAPDSVFREVIEFER